MLTAVVVCCNIPAVASIINESELPVTSWSKVLDVEVFKGPCKEEENATPSLKILLIDDNFLESLKSSESANEVA